MHSPTLASSQSNQRLKFILLSALSITILLFTVVHLRHMVPSHSSHTPPTPPNSYASTTKLSPSTPRPHHYGVGDLDISGLLFESEKGEKKIKSSPHKFSIADLNVWQSLFGSEKRKERLSSHQETIARTLSFWERVEDAKGRLCHHETIAKVLKIWEKIEAEKESHPNTRIMKPVWVPSKFGDYKNEVVKTKGGKSREKSEMHGNGGELCDSFFVSDLLGCGKVVNGKFRGGLGRKPLGGKVEKEMKKDVEVEIVEIVNEVEEGEVMRKEDLR